MDNSDKLIRINDDLSILSCMTINKHLVNQWNLLLSLVKNKSFLHLYQWYDAYMQSYYMGVMKKTQSIFIVIQYQKKPVAIFPLIQQESFVGPLRVTSIELMWSTDLQVRDCIISDEVNIKYVGKWLMQALKAAGIKWDIFLLPDIVDKSSAYRVVTQQGLYPISIHQHHFTARIPATGDESTCFEFLSTRMRKRLDRYYKNLTQKGEVRFKLIRAGELTEKQYDMFLNIESSSWKGGSGTKTALRYDIKQERLYRALFTGSLESRMIASLWVGDEPVAAKLCLVVGDTLYMMKIGYRQDYWMYYPGMLLLRHLIQHYSSNPHIHQIAFVTSPDWAKRWRPELHKVFSATIYNNTITGVTAHQINTAKEQARKLKARYREWKKFRPDSLWVLKN